MTLEEMLKRYDEFYAKNRQILVDKGTDYAKKEDRLMNLNSCQKIGITPARGVMVRMLDKLTRISNLLSNEAQVKDENIEDTIRDLSNYAFLLSLLV